jgi:MFS family permease
MRRNAVLFVLISLLSGFGGTALTLAAGIWVLDLTGSVGLAGLTGLCLYAPVFVAPWLGALVDRLPKRPLLIVVEVALGSSLLTLLAVSSARDTWLIFVVLLGRGLGYALSDAGETAILPAALTPSLLGDVNGWRSSAQEGMKLLAPLAGAGLYAWRGALPVVLVSAAMPLLTAVCYGLLRVTGPAGGAGRVPGSLRDGLRVLVRDPVVRVPVLVAAGCIALSGFTGAAVLAQIVRVLHLPATYLGFLSTAQGAGSMVGGLLVGRLLARSSPATVAGAGAVVFASGRLVGCVPWWPAVIAGSVLVGVGLPWTLVAGITAVQTGTPAHLLGRVSATSNTVMFGPLTAAIPAGSALVALGAIVPLLTAGVLGAVLGRAALGARPRSRQEAGR